MRKIIRIKNNINIMKSEKKNVNSLIGYLLNSSL